MAEGSIPVDLFNPGQVFACVGFLEAADLLLGDAKGGFDWSDEESVRFLLRVKGDDDPFATVLEFLSKAEVSSVKPFGSAHDTSKWNVPTTAVPAHAPFPFPNPPSPATLPAVLEGPSSADSGSTVTLQIDHWGDATRRDPVKFWGGSAGYPGAALARDAIDLVRDRLNTAASDPFGVAVPQTSSFRLDWRRDYTPIDAGFSLNRHGHIEPTGFPLVELLAAFGLSNARPMKLNQLEYRYSVIASADGASPFPPSLLRAALGDARLPFRSRRFTMRLSWPGKEGQARCIRTVTEETSA